MPREFASVNVAIWSDPEFRALPAAAQGLYLTLWTSPGLTYCGTHDWRPKRLAALSQGSTTEAVETIADCLQARHFLVVDEETDEALVRSWARFDGLVKKPRMAVSYASAYAVVASAKLREVLAHETHKMRQMWPELTCWGDPRVTQILEHPRTSAKDLPTPGDPFVDGLPSVCGPFVANASKGLPPVCDPPTPAPTPAPTPSTPQGHLADVAKDSPSADADGDLFDEFWTRYPRKVDKGHARKAWKAAAKKVDDPWTIINACRSWAVRIAGADAKFIPHGATWLNGERWLDEEEAQRAESAGEDVGWFQPFDPGAPPPEVADDPERYDHWLSKRRDEWRANMAARG